MPLPEYSGALAGFEIGAHALRATAATNALDHQADIAKVQEWLGRANIATTRIYDHRTPRPEGQPDVQSSVLIVFGCRRARKHISTLPNPEEDTEYLQEAAHCAKVQENQGPTGKSRGRRQRGLNDEVASSSQAEAQDGQCSEDRL